jgi:pimeloyl-ACP methyl ester carboxylesterase
MRQGNLPMPTVRIAPDLEMHCLIDDFTDPWRTPDTILLLHGNAESGAAWYGWVPHLARHFRVVRPDMRGYGNSTAMDRDFPWSIDVPIDDLIKLMDTLAIGRLHLVAAKIGGFIARRFAARFPERVMTLTVVGTPPPRYEVTARVTPLTTELEEQGVEHWARRTMTGRLGSQFPQEGIDWWIRLMSRTPVSSVICFIKNISSADITQDLRRIKCPTLVITTEGSALSSVEETRAWQVKIPRSELLVLPGDSYHVAASDPDRCAQETRDFILRARVDTA